MMTERKIDNRGSKPVTFYKNNITVKEQRVDGNRYKGYTPIRCTLMGFERNYQIKILSEFASFSLLRREKNQINKVRSYTSKTLVKRELSVQNVPQKIHP